MSAGGHLDYDHFFVTVIGNWVFRLLQRNFSCPWAIIRGNKKMVCYSKKAKIIVSFPITVVRITAKGHELLINGTSIIIERFILP